MMGGDSIAVDQQEDRQMIDDRTVYHLLDHIACEVIEGMRHGKMLEEIDDDLAVLRKVDRIALFEHMVELAFGGKQGDAIVAHLRALKRQKPLPQPIPLPANVIPLRPDL
jgi:hypothetical protein